MSSDIYEDTVYGQVLPLEDDDTIPGIAIIVDGEEEFIVEQNESSASLIDHIDRWVTAEGIITETDDEFRIKIRNFKIEDELDYSGDDNW